MTEIVFSLFLFETHHVVEFYISPVGKLVVGDLMGYMHFEQDGVVPGKLAHSVGVFLVGAVGATVVGNPGEELG